MNLSPWCLKIINSMQSSACLLCADTKEKTHLLLGKPYCLTEHIQGCLQRTRLNRSTAAVMPRPALPHHQALPADLGAMTCAVFAQQSSVLYGKRQTHQCRLSQGLDVMINLIAKLPPNMGLVLMDVSRTEQC